MPHQHLNFKKKSISKKETYCLKKKNCKNVPTFCHFLSNQTHEHQNTKNHIYQSPTLLNTKIT